MKTKSKIVMGAFDSENYWRNEDLAKLPLFNDKEATNIVLAMDELLFPFCSKDDVLITRFKMNEDQKRYLDGIGFKFNSNEISIDLVSQNPESKGKCVFELLAASEHKEYFRGLIPEDAELVTFAAIPHAYNLSKQYRLGMEAPSIDIIRKVNSKVYSVELNKKIGEKDLSKVITSHIELLTVGKEFLEVSQFLIKDEFGVSGKGNLLINSVSILERIAAFIAGQESKGKVVRFIVEPFLNKTLDFSCQFYINILGEFSLISVQKLLNIDFAYRGSFTADKEFMEMLENKGYFKTMRLVANELYKSGYYGHVCVDSMLLERGEIKAVVEINARKSMSLIKHQIDRFLSVHFLKGSMTYVSVSYTANIKYEDVLENLEKNKFLFGPGRENGVIPLSANSLLINRIINGINDEGPKKPVKGRLYLSVVSKDSSEIDNVLSKTKELLSTLSFKILN